MNDREKKLILLLVAAVVLIGTIFLYTTYDSKMKKNKGTYKRNADELTRMKADLAEADSKIDDVEWLAENPPVESMHGAVSADLAEFTEKSALRSGVDISKKRPAPQDEDPNEFGAYRSAVVRATANAMDDQLYRWLVDLQSPNDHRSITRLYIKPQRDDNTKVDCELEITQWFTPRQEEAESSDEEF